VADLRTLVQSLMADATKNQLLHQQQQQQQRRDLGNQLARAKVAMQHTFDRRAVAAEARMDQLQAQVHMLTQLLLANQSQSQSHRAVPPSTASSSSPVVPLLEHSSPALYWDAQLPPPLEDVSSLLPAFLMHECHTWSPERGDNTDVEGR